ncbi:peptidylprolyl isomerase [Mucilaginibacter pallidiroseus]|uniref:peptidylprolyl isomerase n=1 Tax=Mucilaginibacter pallidiroseus TaxID=2599295 RepID=A0A563UG09_9SPHI|nr:FKBP-type peptidyl-prolyl cis-trans isomerase [Mucilaginibacter pallidiroseus]TWR30305.1 peptidylprolyl isomerase [Mucilaginibacter pallidiroseus]
MKNTIYTIALLLLGGMAANAQVAGKTSKGVQYQIIGSGQGVKIKQNDVITFHAVQKTDKDSTLFSTYAQGQPVKTQVRPSSNIGDLMDIFPLMSVNDSAIVRVPTDSVFKGHEEARPPFMAKGSSIVFNIKIVKVQTLDEAMAERTAGLEKLKTDEKAAADAYIAQQKLMPKATASGLKYVITKVGTGIKPVNGDSVEVNYAGRTTDGKLFDSSIESVAKAGGLEQPGRTYEPIKFVVGAGNVIPGWDEGLLLLNQGSTAKLIIPSALAYGERGGGSAIAPYSTLVFDVELVKVTHPKKAAVSPATKRGVKGKAPVKKRSAVKRKN